MLNPSWIKEKNIYKHLSIEDYTLFKLDIKKILGFQQGEGADYISFVY
jgi:hypothetical protein